MAGAATSLFLMDEVDAALDETNQHLVCQAVLPDAAVRGLCFFSQLSSCAGPAVRAAGQLAAVQGTTAALLPASGWRTGPCILRTRHACAVACLRCQPMG